MDEQNELLIQKCVDGELEVAAQQDLLARLDHLMDGWKMLALAYVEEQCWANRFPAENRAIAAEEPGSTSAVVATGRPAAAAAVDSESATAGPATGSPRTGRSGGSTAVTRLTCVAIALVGGILIGDIWNDNGPGDLAGNPAPTGIPKNLAASGSGALAGGNSVKGSIPYEVQVPAGQGRNVSVPAYRADLVDHGPNLLPSDSVDQELKRLGFRFEDDHGAIVVELENGEKVLIPVQSVRIAPSGQ